MACASRLKSITADRCPYIGTHLIVATCTAWFFDQHANYCQLCKFQAGGLSLQRLPGTLRHTLVSLSISSCPRINSESFLWLTGGQGHNTPTCGKLQLLDISCCTGVNDTGVTAIASRLKNLQYLSLRKCSAITDHGIIALGSGCPLLQVVNLEWLTLLTDASIIHLAKGCVKLISLNVGQCSKLTDKAVIALARNCSKLQAVSVAGVPAITERAFGALVR